MKYSKYNVIIIGSGLAGLYLANKLADEKSFTEGVVLVTKESLFSGSTSLAQGGIVSVIPEINKIDSVESHIKDTITAGCGINDINTVRFVSEKSSVAAQELIAMGVEFDKNSKNMLNFTMEGAHSCPRILHSNGDSTGRVIEEVLCKNAINNNNLSIYENTMAVEILTDSMDTARGIVTYNQNDSQFETIYSNNVVIATGGIGQLYTNTTNPLTSTADGIALAINVGVQVSNMEFVQFHPTGLYCKGKSVVPLVSESVRGEGAKLVNINGEYFAKKYHKDADLAPRDIVSRAIINEMQLTSSDHVNLDISQIGIENFRLRFPTISQLCLENDIDISDGLIPVMPVQHYFMGGILTDIYSKTNIKNLYAVGECSMTGLHGANRLASNSLLECAVFAQNLYEYLIKYSALPQDNHDELIQKKIEKYININSNSDDINQVEDSFVKLKEIMTENVGIIRNHSGLQNAYTRISNLEKKLNMDSNLIYRRKFELVNAICVSKSIIKAALNRADSIGAHYRDDCPVATDNNTHLINGNINYDELLA